MFSVPPWDKTKYEVLETREHSNRWLRLIGLDRFATWKTVKLPAAYREPVTVDFIVPRADRIRKPARIVIAFQILGGDDIVSKIIAYYFALKGYPAIVVHRSKELFKIRFKDETSGIEYPLDSTLGQLNENIKNVGIIHRQAIDFAIWYLTTESQLPEVDTTSICAIGVSLGGITLSGISAVEPLIAKSVIVMGGGDVAEVLTTSRENSVKRNVDGICKHYNISRDDLKAEIRKHVTYGNLRTIYTVAAEKGHIPSWTYRMVVSMFDKDVPTETQRVLRRTLGCKAMYLPTGHYTAAPFLPLILWWARKFFERA